MAALALRQNEDRKMLMHLITGLFTLGGIMAFASIVCDVLFAVKWLKK